MRHHDISHEETIDPLVAEPRHEKLNPQTYVQVRTSLPVVLAEALHFGKLDFRSFSARTAQQRSR